MGLSHLKLASETVVTPGGESFSVRGLSFVDISAVVRPYGPQLGSLFDGFKDGTFSLDDPTALLSNLINRAPEAAALVIAVAADEEDVALAARLPFPVQLEALEKIAGLTFASEGGAKKVLETIIRVATGTTSALASLKA